MIQIILVNEESRASQYGIGTYIKQLCLILSQKQGIHLSAVSYTHLTLPTILRV